MVCPALVSKFYLPTNLSCRSWGLYLPGIASVEFFWMEFFLTCWVLSKTETGGLEPHTRMRAKQI